MWWLRPDRCGNVAGVGRGDAAPAGISIEAATAREHDQKQNTRGEATMNVQLRRPKDQRERDARLAQNLAEAIDDVLCTERNRERRVNLVRVQILRAMQLARRVPKRWA
jgi:hypothetical protein